MFKTLLINSAFRLIDKFLISNLPEGVIKDYISGQMSPLKRIANAMTDKNPDNKEQLRQIWYEENDDIVVETVDALQIIIANRVEEDKASIYVDILEGIKLEILEEVKGETKWIESRL